jgi:hypothetical protein
MNLNQWRDEIHALAKEKGWWEGVFTWHTHAQYVG